MAENDIETLEVGGAVESAIGFYKKTGAEQITPTDYKYDVRRTLSKLYKKSNELSNIKPIKYTPSIWYKLLVEIAVNN